MMFRGLIISAVAAFAFVVALDSSSSQGGDKKKPASIKAVMKKAMAGGLCKKVAGGEATAEEKAELLTLFKDLAANKCPKGDEDSWKEKTKALVDAVKADDAAALKKAANCAACHKEHKGK